MPVTPGATISGMLTPGGMVYINGVGYSVQSIRRDSGISGCEDVNITLRSVAIVPAPVSAPPMVSMPCVGCGKVLQHPAAATSVAICADCTKQAFNPPGAKFVPCSGCGKQVEVPGITPPGQATACKDCARLDPAKNAAAAKLKEVKPVAFASGSSGLPSRGWSDQRRRDLRNARKKVIVVASALAHASDWATRNALDVGETIFVSTSDPDAVARLQGMSSSIAFRVEWVGPWGAGKYADAIERELGVRFPGVPGSPSFAAPRVTVTTNTSRTGTTVDSVPAVDDSVPAVDEPMKVGRQAGRPARKSRRR